MIASAAQAWDVLQRAWVVVASDGNDTLGQALDVAGRAIPPERTVVVSTVDRSGAAGALAPGRAHVLIEPRDRGSAATVLSPVHWIHAREADATVIVLTDGIGERADVDPGAQGDLFGALVTAAQLIHHHPEQLVVLGAGAQGEASVSAERVDGALDRACGFVGRTRAFIAAGRDGCAGLADRLARAAAFVGQEHERWALRQAYALAPSADFPEAVRAARQPLAVVPIPSQGGREPGRHSLALARGTMRSLERWSEALLPAVSRPAVAGLSG